MSGYRFSRVLSWVCVIEPIVVFDPISLTITAMPAGFISELLSLGATNVTDLSRCWDLSQSDGYFMLKPVIRSSYVKNSESEAMGIIRFSCNKPNAELYSRWS